MKKLAYACLVFFGFWSYANADSKLTALTVDTTAQASDLVYKVDSPGGTPQSRSITISNMLSQVGTSSVTANAVLDVSIVSVAGSKITGTAGIPNAAIDGSSITKQGNTFNGASQLVQTSGSTLIPNALVDASSVTKQGNIFNGASQLVQTNGSTQLPAISGALVTNLNASNLASGTIPNARQDASSVTLQGQGVAVLAGTNTFSGGNTFTSSTTVTSTFSATGVSSVLIGQTVLISTNNIFQVGTSTTMAYTNSGHLEFHASTSPTITSCGIGGNVASGSSDITGSFTMGAATVSCTLVFSQFWKNVPQCFGNDETGVNAVKFTPTTQNVVVTTAGTGGDLVDYFCVGEQ